MTKRQRILFSCLMLLFFSLSVSPFSYALVIAGYQGWFGCPGDYKDNKNWQHWIVNGDFVVDLLPYTDIYPQNALCDTGISTKSGKTVKLFSSQSFEIVDMHMKLAEQYGIDVIALQRFVNEIEKEKPFLRKNHVLENIIKSTKNKNIKFFIMYDISGANEETVYDNIVKDIEFLTKNYDLFNLFSYYRENNKPVVALWGFGFTNRPGNPEDTILLIKQLKLKGFTVMGGIPSNWRSLSKDSKSSSLWLDVYLEYDILSPWMVGRFKDETSMNSFYKNIVQEDIKFLKKKNKKYIPVVFPGFSWYNLQKTKGKSVVFNLAPKNCGDFLRLQLNKLKQMGLSDFYVAMLDEFNEGTAILPHIIYEKQLPDSNNWKFAIPLYDSCSVSSPFYLMEALKNNK